MHNSQEDQNSRLKLAQLWHIVKRPYNFLTDFGIQKLNSDSKYRMIQEILKEDFNINYKVTVVPEINLQYKIHLKDCTALHFVYVNSKYINAINIFTALLERGADFTIKNGNGQTVFHLIMKNYLEQINKQINSQFIDLVLSAHIKLQNFNNPGDNNGFTHLHGACIANNVEAVKLFLDNGASVDEAVYLNAGNFAGYTPLHFATQFHSFKVARILVNYGANFNAQTARGENPIDLLFKKKIDRRYSQEKDKLIELLIEKKAVSAVGISNFQIACTLQDPTIAEQLLNKGVDIEYTVPIKSTICTGNTALHFAANNSIESVKMLLKNGVKLDSENAEKKTALELCVSEYNLEEVCDILSCVESLKGICLSDGKTKLLDLITSMKNKDEFESFLKNKVQNIDAVAPNDSILWPGYTILHLAVIFSKQSESSTNDTEQQFDNSMVKECLKRGLSVNTQDVKGKTPIHLAFNQGKNDIVNLLLKQVKKQKILVNLVDEDNLSYLHIASALKYEFLVEKLLKISDASIVYKGRRVDSPYVQPGFTPLHVVSVNESHTIAEMLLKHDANLHAADESGLTPIHWLLNSSFGGNSKTVYVLFNALLTKTTNRVVHNLGFNYLHVASYLGQVKVVENLLKRGLNVDTAITYEENLNTHINENALAYIRQHLNCTPLQLAIKNYMPSKEVVKLLVQHGADIFMKNSNMSVVKPIESQVVVHSFLQVLWEQEDMQKIYGKQLGLTKLHIACYLKSTKAVKIALKMGLDINVRVNSDSIIFAGCTPLHMLMTMIGFYTEFNSLRSDQIYNCNGIAKMLIDGGADVTIMNSENETPIHVFFRYQTSFSEGESCTNLLLGAQKVYNVNPTNNEGLSHFHLACFWQNVNIFEKFVLHASVDINRPIDCFATRYPGFTPLNLALNAFRWTTILLVPEYWVQLSRIVDFLLENGANVTAADVYGNTPLHNQNVFYSPQISILKKLISYGADINCKNIQGEIPIEKCIDSFAIHLGSLVSSNNAKIFEQYGRKFHSWNHITGEGYIAKVFLVNNYGDLSESPEFQKFLNLPEVKVIDDNGRTAIHNSVAAFQELKDECLTENHVFAIDSFMKMDIDIDHQDESGQTALHYSVSMKNVNGIAALLACGADINIVDRTGQSAISYTMKNTEIGTFNALMSYRDIMEYINLHTKKLQYLKLEVNKLNAVLLLKKHTYHPFDRFYLDDVTEDFFDQIQMTKTLNVGTASLTLYGFLSETGAVNSYCFLSKYERDIVDNFFKSINFKKFEELRGIIKLQFNKMKKRLNLIDPAMKSLEKLLDCLVPHLCEHISLYLSNSNLKNVIKSTQ